MVSPTLVCAYLAIFALSGFLFLFANLLLGRFLRPHSPNVEKLEVYECGEPAIGSSFVQFDLRFYVVALLFIIFDVEVAFFFPWANVFGKSVQLSDENLARYAVRQGAEERVPAVDVYRGLVEDKYRELGVAKPTLPGQGSAGGEPPDLARMEQAVRANGRQMAILSIFDIGVFFAVLMVGFAYVWKRGDLDWVRAVQERVAKTERSRRIPSPPEQPILSA